jgi:proteasome activator subunit 4
MYASDRKTGLSYRTGLTFSTGMLPYCTRLRRSFGSIPPSWLSLRYPIPVSTRARLVRLFYELALLPGIEPRLIRSWVDDLSRLIANKGDTPRKIEPGDLQLPWKPLWRVLQKELWPKKRAYESSYAYETSTRFAVFPNYFCRRNSVNILLYLAEQVKIYFPSNEIPAMLDTFLPLITQSVRVILLSGYMYMLTSGSYSLFSS